MVQREGPKAIPRLLISTEKFRQFGCHSGFKKEPEPPVLVVIGSVEFSQSTNNPWPISF
jgi:hypothetical protein